jgi:hypothetical protein
VGRCPRGRESRIGRHGVTSRKSTSVSGPPLKELELLPVVVYRPLATPASAFRREEEMDRIAKIQFLPLRGLTS